METQQPGGAEDRGAGLAHSGDGGTQGAPWDERSLEDPLDPNTSCTLYMITMCGPLVT